MKKLISILLTGFVLTVSVQAQNQVQTQEQTQLQEHLMFKDGKLFRVRNQEHLQLHEPLRLQNGCLVNPDGTYQLQNQKQLRLKNGECLDMSGNRYKTQQAFRQQMQARSHAMNREHLMFQNGQVFRIRNQEKIQLQEKVTLQNGDVVNPNGICQLKNGKQLRLKEGECLDMNGNRYENQNRFHQKMQRMNNDPDMPKRKSKNAGRPGGNKGAKGGGRN